MNKKDLQRFRHQLEDLTNRMQSNISSETEQAHGAGIIPAVGELSNAPMHLGDLGTEEYLRDINAVLLENETYLVNEAIAALGRIQNGTFGTCANCGCEIPRERLEALPYARYCTACAEQNAGQPANLNEGRPQRPGDTLAGAAEAGRPEEGSAAKPTRPRRGKPQPDVHAAGTPAGGTAIGGLAGSTSGRGEPAEGDLADAMGSGDFDARISPENGADNPRSGASGGAVGGTPAGKRSRERVTPRTQHRRRTKK
jgi:RNA polymerase-binding transcription factor DksA